MPIIGLTNQTAQWPTIGTLRKGAEKSERSPGRDLDHFRFDTDDTIAAAAFESAYGKQPREVTICLPHRTLDQNFMAFRESWTASKLNHRCDGEQCYSYNQHGVLAPNSIKCPDIDKQNKSCKQVGRLSVIVYGLQRYALVTVLTTSIHDIVALSQQLGAIEALRADLSGIPLLLSRVEKEISMPKSDGTRVRVKKWMLQIEVSPEWATLQLQSMQRQALQMPAPVLELAAPIEDERHIDHDTGEILEDSEPELQANLNSTPFDQMQSTPTKIEARQPRSEIVECNKCGTNIAWSKNPETDKNDRYNVDAQNIRTDELHCRTCGKTAAPVSPSRPCKKCNALIVFADLNGKDHPYDATEDGQNSGVSHFDTCPNAQEFRDAQKAKTTNTPIRIPKPATIKSADWPQDLQTSVIGHIRDLMRQLDHPTKYITLDLETMDEDALATLLAELKEQSQPTTEH